MTVKLAVTLTFAFTSLMLADVYDHSGRVGDFQDGKWINKTTSPPGGPNVFGSPGAGDDGYFLGTITASGGSVHLLSGRETQLPTRETRALPGADCAAGTFSPTGEPAMSRLPPPDSGKTHREALI